MSFATRITDALSVHHMSKEDFCKEVDLTPKTFKEYLRHPEEIPTNVWISFAGVLGVDISYLSGWSVFPPHISLPAHEATNGYWGAMTIQLTPTSEVVWKPISYATMIITQAQLAEYQEETFVLPIPCMDNTVLFLHSDRFFKIAFHPADSEAIPEKKREELQLLVYNYTSLSLLKEFVEMERPPKLFSPAKENGVIMKPKEMKRVLDRLNQVILSNGSVLHLDPQSILDDSVIHFCMNNLGPYGCMKHEDDRIPWSGNDHLLIPQAEVYWPKLMEFVEKPFDSETSFCSTINMKDVAMLQFYLPDIGYGIMERKQMLI